MCKLVADIDKLLDSIERRRLYGSDVITEAVIFIDTKTFIDKIRVDRILSSCKSNVEFIDRLNRVFKKYRVQFKASMKNFTAEIDGDGHIFIDASYNFFDMFKGDENRFIHKMEITLQHELVHREQFNRIDFSKYKVSVGEPIDAKDYFRDKHEIMSYAYNIVTELGHRFITKGQIMKFLLKPYPNVSVKLDMYIDSFGKERKVINRLYKYMYEYLMNGEIK